MNSSDAGASNGQNFSDRFGKGEAKFECQNARLLSLKAMSHTVVKPEHTQTSKPVGQTALMSVEQHGLGLVQQQAQR